MTAAVGAALRIAAEQNVDVTAEQLRAVLRDTATCLRRIRDDAAWRVVAEDSGAPEAFEVGFIQAVQLIEQSSVDAEPVTLQDDPDPGIPEDRPVVATADSTPPAGDR